MSFNQFFIAYSLKLQQFIPCVYLFSSIVVEYFYITINNIFLINSVISKIPIFGSKMYQKYNSEFESWKYRLLAFIWHQICFSDMYLIFLVSCPLCHGIALMWASKLAPRFRTTSDGTIESEQWSITPVSN